MPVVRISMAGRPTPGPELIVAPTTCVRHDGPVRRTSGLAALLGAGCFAVTAVGTLVTGDRVPWLFEVAPPVLGLCLLLLPTALGLVGSRGAVTAMVGGMVMAVGAAAVVADVVGESWGPGVAIAMIGVSTGALVAGWDPRSWMDRALLAAAVSPFVGLAVGGALEDVDDRLLDLGLFLVAGAWAWVGALLLRGPER
jgi:hypothetical protein